jgi:dihydropyrimidine dehydrogenase (NAD+) subunit PreA
MNTIVRESFDRYPSVYPLRDLSVVFCGFELENPFILSAAPSTDELDILRRGLAMGWAGAVLKTTSMPGTPVSLTYPLMTGWRAGDHRLLGMGNIDLISVYNIDEIVARVKALKKEFPRKLIAASIMGQTREAWQTLARDLCKAGADLIECSFSCPQGSMGEEPGKMLAQSAEATERVARWVKEAADTTPVLIKITPLVTDIAEIARAVERAGCDGVTAANSFPSLMGVNLRTFVPEPNIGGFSTFSGYTGPAIKPLTLYTVARIAQATRLAISGNGGISNWHDTAEVMAVGAGCVQLCTAVMHYGFQIIDDLTSGLSHLLDETGLANVNELVGRALPNLRDHDSLPRQKVRSHINEQTCIRCNVCYLACRDGGHIAIEYRGQEQAPRVLEEKCVGCGLCAQVCPVVDCVTMELCIST